LIPLGLGIIITGFISGALTDKIGVQALTIIGPLVSALGCIGLATIRIDMDYWLMAFSMFVIGLGNGIFVRCPPADNEQQLF